MTNILIVDDEEYLRRTLAWQLEEGGYSCTLAASAEEARQRLKEKEFALVLCDVNMPGESGLDLVQDVMAEYSDSGVVMVSGVDNPAVANIALERGASGYIVKPFTTNEVLINVANALRRRRLEIENRHHRERLEQVVEQRTADLQKALERLKQAEKEIRQSREETIYRLARVAESRDLETAQHIVRMSRYCELLARRLNLGEERCELIRLASPMHDIGKVAVPDRILHKEGALTPEEITIMRRHAEAGYHILADSHVELLNLAAAIALTHHEKFDGTGYPRGLRGQEIPLEGRIAAIADVFDAITTKRVYKPAYPLEQACDMMREGSGHHFDPELLQVFLQYLDDIGQIMKQYPGHSGG